MKQIADGFSLAEAPTITPDGVLLVSDVIAGGVRRFDAGGDELERLVDGRRGVGGMGLLPGGAVVMSGRDLTAVKGERSAEVAPLLPGGTGYNDLAITADGQVLVGMLTCRPMAGDALTPGVLVGICPDGRRETLGLPFCWPNGIGLNADETRLWFADYATGVVYSSPWAGSVAALELEPWATSPSGEADGIAVADDGSVWVASGSGGSLLRYRDTGDLVETLEVPDEFVSSCCLWPGADRLAITTGTAVFVHDLG